MKSAVLWYCLVDPSHDSCLIKKIESEVMSSNAPSTEFEDHYDVILGFRLGILQHLTSHLQRFSGRSRSGSAMTPPHVLLKELARMQPFFAQCLRLATFLLSKLPEVLGADLDTIRAKRLALLTAAYFRLLLVSMEICLDIQRDGSLETNQHNTHLLGPGQFFVLYRSIMGAERPLTDAITMADDVVHNPVSFKSVLQSFRRYLTKCRDTTVVTEMLETLSVLALHSNEDEAVIEMVRISWTAFHSKFLDDGATSGPVIPFALTEALNRFSPGAMLNSNPTTIKDAAIRETLLKSAFCNTKVQENQSFLVQGMLRHWGFLVLSEHLYQSSADHLHQLFASLQSFLGEAHESIGPKQRIQKDENRSGDDDEYLPPKRSRSIKPTTVLPEPVIPGLNQCSYFAYFQTLLDITVSSCALFRIKDDGDWIDSMNGPYTPLSNLVETFGSLVDLFRQRMHIFPRQCFASVLNACRSMLNVALAQSTQCIEWRSSQPVLAVEKIEVKAFDPASVQNLGNVFDAFGIYVVGTLDALCGSIESMGISTADPANGIVPGLSQKQKVKALRLKVNKVCSYLQKSAAEHNLPTPRQSLQEVTNGQPTRKRRRIEIWGFHNFESSPEDSVDTKNIPGPSNFHANARKRALAQPSLTDEAISSELTWEEGSSEDDGSFGADGDWGRQSEEEDEIRINAGT